MLQYLRNLHGIPNGIPANTLAGNRQRPEEGKHMNTHVKKAPFGETDNTTFFRWIAIVAVTLIAVIAAVVVIPPLLKGATAIKTDVVAPATQAVKDGLNQVSPAAISNDIAEKTIGDRLAKESDEFIRANFPGAQEITEVPPGKSGSGKPDVPWFTWKTGMWNIHKSTGRENSPLYVEYTYIDTSEAPHHVFLMHDMGKWQVVDQD